jgi:hypothetical protein
VMPGDESMLGKTVDNDKVLSTLHFDVNRRDLGAKYRHSIRTYIIYICMYVCMHACNVM